MNNIKEYFTGLATTIGATAIPAVLAGAVTYALGWTEHATGAAFFAGFAGAFYTSLIGFLMSIDRETKGFGMVTPAVLLGATILYATAPVFQ